MVTNAKANAGIHVRWNVWNLYINLCWREKTEQFKPALALASTVTIKFKNSRQTTVWQNITTFFVPWKLFLRETQVRQSSSLPRQFWFSSVNFSAECSAETAQQIPSSRQIRRDLAAWLLYSKNLRIRRKTLGKTFNELCLKLEI